MDPVIAAYQPAPLFSLPDLEGNLRCLEEARGKIMLLNFWSAECPWAERVDREIMGSLAAWGGAVALWSIASNANEPVELLQRVATERGLPLVLLDQDHRVADRYGAQTTPHLFVVDRDGILRYQGAFDDVNFRRRTPTQGFLRQAVEALLAGGTPEPMETPAYGCTIVRALP